MRVPEPARKTQDERFEALFASPIGVIRVVGTTRGVSELEFVRGGTDRDPIPEQGSLWDAGFQAPGRNLKRSPNAERVPARQAGKARPGASGADLPEPVAACLRQLEAYFAGRLTRFDVPLDLGGTPFERRIWAALTAVPYGATTTYGKLAALLGKPSAARAVGGANHRNPVSIIVPCHRVIGASGGLTGYGGGLWRKEWLLAHERKNAPR